MSTEAADPFSQELSAEFDKLDKQGRTTLGGTREEARRRVGRNENQQPEKSAQPQEAAREEPRIDGAAEARKIIEAIEAGAAERERQREADRAAKTAAQQDEIIGLIRGS